MPDKGPTADLPKKGPAPSTDEVDLSSVNLPAPLVLPYLIILRVLNAFTIHTFFQPDEYLQALEPAHWAVFGYGNLTWEWTNGLRSFVHPLLYALPYKLSEWTGFGVVGVLYFPKVLNGLLAAFGDYYTYKFVQRAARGSALEQLARWALLVSITSGWNWYMVTRSFSSSLEMILTTIALAHWPWGRHVYFADTAKALSAAAVSCLIRPTNGLLWLFFGAALLVRVRSSVTRAKLAVLAITIGSFFFALGMAADYAFYGKPTVPLLNFVRFNVFSNLSVFYGLAPWHFYLFQGLPVILLAHLPLTLMGFSRLWRSQFAFLTVLIILVYSMMTHKEFRFIYPLQPLFVYFTAHGFHRIQRSWLKPVIIATILLNTAISLFFTQIHERGVMDVMEYLREDIDVGSIGFLTPCHSTPMQSHLHLDIPIMALSCDPPLHLIGNPAASTLVKTYQDESDIFYADPVAFLTQKFPPPIKAKRESGKFEYEWPTHLVFFENLEPIMKPYLEGSGYQECERFFNTWFHWDNRRSGDVIVYCKWPWE
ncbi:glycosyltransferase family 22 protein [Babjeviella inositovora NRRL Y-12698]|uniref:Mannosyltransferase n=1 Tax=Babjeviella inositovora NRRL Y-12698 TaxID=984486 RepID=A0A1E3QSB5_9ASCO|nr:glycosyltransferase family 22 protein [Babjeviella inositovora NRRL Y-12698]ODQ80606.1 glycosyltransferase family 22 protein [Babjeviella inositovora NRRL Y-12698]